MHEGEYRRRVMCNYPTNCMLYPTQGEFMVLTSVNESQWRCVVHAECAPARAPLLEALLKQTALSESAHRFLLHKLHVAQSSS